MKMHTLFRKLRRLHTGIRRPAIILAAILGYIFLPSIVLADNFAITSHPTSDPAPSVFTYNGETRVYLYCTQDKLNATGSYPIDTIHCYSTNDMFHWRDEGVALDEQSCGSWANRGAHQLWAPTVVYYKGKYRLFISAVDKSGNSDPSARIFTATADSPKGPFIPSTTPPYLSNIGIGLIDPFCFIDTLADGSTTAILSYRSASPGIKVSMALLNADATDVVGNSWVANTLESTGYKEGTWIFKRNNYYYLIYATADGTPRETINYATAPVSAGGITASTVWTKHGVLINMNSSEWTIHSGVCHFTPKGTTQDKWYVFYHGVKESEMLGDRLFNSGMGRCTAIEEITFTSSTPALMATVKKTARGVGICNATDSIQVDRYSSASNCAVTTIQHPGTSAAPTGWYVSNIANNGTLTYENVDFTATTGNAIGTVVANVASSNATGTIKISAGSTVLGTIAVPNTGGISKWQTTTPLTLTAKPAAGVQNITLTFTTSATGSFNVNWIKFNEVPGTSIKIGNTYFDKTGFAFERLNKANFKVDCASTFSNAEVKIYSMAGREIAKALRTSLTTSNSLSIHINENQVSSGAYILSIKNNSRSLQVPLTF